MFQGPESAITTHSGGLPHPLFGVVVVLGCGGAVGGLGAERQVLLQGGLLVQGGVAHVFVDRVDGHLSDVLCCLTEETVTVNQPVSSSFQTEPES